MSTNRLLTFCALVPNNCITSDSKHSFQAGQVNKASLVLYNGLLDQISCHTCAIDPDTVCCFNRGLDALTTEGFVLSSASSARATL